MKRNIQHYGKNVTLTLEAIEVVNGYMNRTRKNFSQTLDIIVKEWDNISVQLEKVRKEKELKQNLQYLDDISKAKVVK